MAIHRAAFADTGIEVASICLGTMMFGERADEAESIGILHHALGQGLNFWDTAPMYAEGRSEAILGKAMVGRRDRVFLAGKVNDVTYKAIVEGCDASLARMQTDRLDLFQIHWPRKGMDLDEITRALDDLAKAGKVRFVGCCNFPAWILAKARALADQTGRVRMVSFQPPYNMIERGIEVELLPMCLHERIAVIPYRPLVMGLLSGKYRPGAPLPADTRSVDDDRIGRLLANYATGIDGLARFAAERSTTPAAVALAWVRGRPGVTAPIAGISSRVQLDELLRNAAFTLTTEEAAHVASLFDAEVKEEAVGNFPGWRRNMQVLAG